MKEIIIPVDDDVEWVEIEQYGEIESRVVPDLYENAFNEMGIFHIKIHRKQEKELLKKARSLRFFAHKVVYCENDKGIDVKKGELK